jgi:hypothetical protein
MEQQSDVTNNSEGKFQKLIAAGAEMAGAALGGAIGLLGGPAGAIAGGAAGAAAAAVLKHIGSEAAERLLGPREKVRVGAALAIAAADIKSRIDGGETLRSDDFFTEKAPQRSSAEEVAESVLLKCQREPEEKKVRYMGRLISSVAFDAKISAPMAQQITKIAEALTYRQLCILKLASAQWKNLRSHNYRGQQQFSKELYQVLYECLDLYQRGLINFGGEVAFGPTDVEPQKMSIQGLGADVFNLMGLNDVPLEDVKPVALQLV